MRPGSVALVGAGPGDPELITVRGLRRLQVAEVLLYDRLVHPDLVAETPSICERIYVGKRTGCVAMPQRTIERLLVDRARAGKRVVRLKGGDPFLFGRGGEEAIACADAGVACEVVPAVTSALASPLSIGVPVTHRGVSASLTVLSGHRSRAGDRSCAEERSDTGDRPLDPDHLGAETLVILMGMNNLERICRQLIDSGRSAETPAAVIERATWRDQNEMVATLSTLPEMAAQAGLQAPATIVVGEVLRLQSWQHRLADAGRWLKTAS